MLQEAGSNITHQEETTITSLSAPRNITYAVNLQLAVLPTLSLLIAGIGLISNALNLLVLHAYHTSQLTCGGERTARVNLLGLALADFSVCLTSLPLGFVHRTHSSYSFMLFYTIVGPALATYFLTVSVWMVLLVSVSRYLAVCRPLTSRTLLTSQHMFRVILSVYLTALLFHTPSFLMYTFEESDSLHGLNYTHCDPFIHEEGVRVSCSVTPTIFVYERPFWSNQAVQVCYHVIQIIVTNIGPFIGVVISNFAVIRACRRSDACRQSITSSHKLTRNGASCSGTEVCSPGKVHSMRYKQTYMTANYPFRGVYILKQNSQYRLSLQHFPNRATNRVTPLLLAVMFAFLVFTAPFGIVHFVCLQVMREMGIRVRDDPEARRLYTSLNLTVEWTNVVQLLGCASNFFLYFLVSTTFRRTTKRTFQRLFKQTKECRRNVRRSFYRGKSTSSSWENDQRTNELRRALDQKLCRMTRRPDDIVSVHSLHNPIQNRLRARKRTWPSNDQLTSALFEQCRAHSSPLPDMRNNGTGAELIPFYLSSGCLGCDYKLCSCNSGYPLQTHNARMLLSHCPPAPPFMCQFCATLNNNNLSACLTTVKQLNFPVTHAEQCVVHITSKDCVNKENISTVSSKSELPEMGNAFDISVEQKGS